MIEEAADFAARIDPRWTLVVLLVVVDAWALGHVWLSTAGRRERLLWTGVIIACPIVGCLFWYVLGPKRRRREEALES